MPLRLSLATALWLGLGLVNLARADGLILQHTIPREVPAYNFTTRGPYYAPPVPYGHYAKDYVYDAHKAVGCAICGLQGLMGLGSSGHGLLHKGHGDGADAGDESAQGHGFGHGGFGHGHGGYGGDGIAGGDAFGSVFGAGSSGGTAGYATTQPLTTAQSTAGPSGQAVCGQAGCIVAGSHSHLGSLANKFRCGLCNGTGCGACGGTGAVGTGCSLCGGVGCSHCLSGHKFGLGGLSSAVHGKLASVYGAFHKPKISWFLGAGGPVPLTPGYVPYIVVTRSPRDYFSFPPMNPNDP